MNTAHLKDTLHVVTCPLCNADAAIAELGNGQNSHLARAWIDNLHERVDFIGEAPGKITKYAADKPHGARGSCIGFVCTYEQCAHVVEFRFQFHKGDVFFEWEKIDPVEAIPEMPRD